MLTDLRSNKLKKLVDQILASDEEIQKKALKTLLSEEEFNNLKSDFPIKHHATVEFRKVQSSIFEDQRSLEKHYETNEKIKGLSLQAINIRLNILDKIEDTLDL